jgi:hypothetical protein
VAVAAVVYFVCPQVESSQGRIGSFDRDSFR